MSTGGQGGKREWRWRGWGGGAGRPTLGVIDPDGTCLREGRAPRNCVWGRWMKPLKWHRAGRRNGEIIINSDFQSVR